MTVWNEHQAIEFPGNADYTYDLTPDGDFGGDETVESAWSYKVAMSNDKSVIVMGDAAEASSLIVYFVDPEPEEPPVENTLQGPVGAAFVYVRGEDGLYNEHQKLVVGGEFAWQFGFSVAISHNGDRIAVGGINSHANAWLDLEYGDRAGRVWIFDRNEDGDWEQTAEFDSGSSDHAGGYGRSLSMSGDGNVLLVGDTGAHPDSVLGAPSGAAFVMEYVDDEWVVNAELGPLDSVSYLMGRSVALDAAGNTAVVRRSSGHPGAYVFKRAAFGDGWDAGTLLFSGTTATGDHLSISDDGLTIVGGMLASLWAATWNGLGWDETLVDEEGDTTFVPVVSPDGQKVLASVLPGDFQIAAPRIYEREAGDTWEFQDDDLLPEEYEGELGVFGLREFLGDLAIFAYPRVPPGSVVWILTLPRLAVSLSRIRYRAER